ncbi:MAG: winged helix-turn-helix transcriptional regulator [Thermoplasmata archaeon]|nr:MAG: winged helix-turn-helix transcriptional regulator [Thermoplasmata archaeon]
MNPKSSENKSKNDLRPKIANYIRMHPGSSFSTIKTIFALSDGTLRYHLKHLEKEGQIKSDDKKRIYYPTGHPHESDLSKVQQKLIHAIKKHPGITQKELAAKTKINRLTVRNNINVLIESEMLSTIRMGKEIHHFYIYPEDLEKTKMLRLISRFLLDKIDEETYWELRQEYAVS